MLVSGKALVDPGWHGNVMSPIFSRLYYICKGAFSIRGKESCKLEEGNWYLIPTGYSFDYECENEMEHFYFHVKLCDFDGTDLLKQCKKPLSIKFDNFSSEFIEQCILGGNLIDGLMLRQTVSEILLTFLDEYKIPIRSEDYSPYIYKAIIYIKQNLSMKLTISEIAENIFISKSTLTKHFRKELSMSVNEYISDMAISEAEKLLSSTTLSVFDISQKLGFSDQFYFSRKFKEYFGKSPREYRKRKLM